MTKRRKVILIFAIIIATILITSFSWISGWSFIFISNVFSCNKAFLDAVETQSISAVKAFIDRGHDPNCYDYRPIVYLESGQSPLGLAAKKKNLELMEYLVAEGAKTEDVLLANDTTPIEVIPFLISKAQLTNDNLNKLLVSYAKRPEIAKILIEKGANVNTQIAPRGWIKKDSSTPLYQASYNTGRAEYSFPEGVKFLLERGADPNLPGVGGNLPLSAAAANRNPDIIRALIKAGADVNRESMCGYPPLIVAAEKGHPDNMKILLEYGVSPDSRDNRNRTNDDCLSGSQLIAHVRGKRLEQEEADNRRRVLGIQDEENQRESLNNNGKPEMAAYAANRKIDGPYDGTALMWAAYSCNAESVKLLLNEGADIRARDAYEATALMWGYACDEKAYKRVVPLLLQAGADPDAKDAGGKTAEEYLPKRQ